MPLSILRAATVSLVLAMASLHIDMVSAQPPYMSGWALTGPDLPNMPIACAAPASSNDGQYCAFACNSDATCMAYNFAEPGCKDVGCPHATGCCWLKTSSSSVGMNTSAPACLGSFIMKPDVNFIPHKQPELPPAGVKNVLYLLVDDLRPDVSPYGASWMVTPNIQALAKSGTTFSRAYTNIAVCSPSRMSFLTGRFPATTHSWNFVNHFRQANCEERRGVEVAGVAHSVRLVVNGGAAQCCSWCTADANCAGWTLMRDKNCHLFNSIAGGFKDKADVISGAKGTTVSQQQWVSLPQYFKDSGYLTMGTGKIFHTEEGGQGPAPWDGPGTGMPPLQDPASWSLGLESTLGNASMWTVNSLAPMRPCADTCSVAGATLAGDVPPGVFTFEDRTIAEDGIAKLKIAAANRADTGQPFFLAVGFRKPHLPFRHPQPWDDSYPAPGDIPLAVYNTMHASVPAIAFHETSIAVNPYTPISTASAGVLRRDYYAAVSWTDSQLGRVTAELAALGLTNDTLVVFHSDHGWSLGEHGEWEKFTNWEHGTRVPLIVSTPWLSGTAGNNVSSIAQLVDVYPTIASLAGLPAPNGTEGVDLSPDIHAAAETTSRGIRTHISSSVSCADSPNGTFALSVYPRCPADTTDPSRFWADNDCMMVERSAFPFMGLSLRTNCYRYTEWRVWNGSALAPSKSTPPVGVELYDHTGDNGESFDGPYEVENLANHTSYLSIRNKLAAQLLEVYPSWAA